MDLHDFRRNYSLGKLSRADLDENPIKQFETWMKQIVDTDTKDPSAMIVATVDEKNQPSQRYVLLKQFDEHGFVFFTDTSSQKGQEIANNPQVSLLFPWHAYERQVRIQGAAEKLQIADVEGYFHSRPKMSQTAAVCSEQSQVIESRAELEKRFHAVDEAQGEISVPERWGGYRVKPLSFEFWQGGEHRLHDRFRYELTANSWQINRLQP